MRHTSFPRIDKVFNVDIFVLPKLKNKFDIVIGHINFHSVYNDQFQFVFKLIQLVTVVTVSILLSLDTIQKCQYCQLCVIRKKLDRNMLGRLRERETNMPTPRNISIAQFRNG